MDNSVLFSRFFDIPIDILPRVRSSSEIYGLMVCVLVSRLSSPTSPPNESNLGYLHELGLFRGDKEKKQILLLKTFLPGSGKIVYFHCCYHLEKAFMKL